MTLHFALKKTLANDFSLRVTREGLNRIHIFSEFARETRPKTTQPDAVMT